MKRACVAVLLLAAISAAPAAHADEEGFTPELTTRVVDEGIKLEWTTPPGPLGQIIDHVEVYRYNPTVSTIDVGAELVGSWDLHAVRNGVAPYYVDEDGATDTFYFVRIVFEDGEKSSPSNPSSVDYPHCRWVLVTVPPVLSPECLFPPPLLGEKAEA